MGSKKILLLIVGLGIILATVLLLKNSGKPESSSNDTAKSPTQVTQNDKPQIVSTNPNPLDNTIISTTQIVEITFNRPLENVGEFKVRIEPETEYKVELSGDRKTAKILPAQPFQLGTTYTMFIGPESKFDGIGRWGEEKVYHFRTIKYTGV